jgi:hypothetical protein
MIFFHCSLRKHWRPQRTLCTPLDCINTAQRLAAQPPGHNCFIVAILAGFQKRNSAFSLRALAKAYPRGEKLLAFVS